MSIEGTPPQVARHLQQAAELDAEGYAQLFEIRMFPPGEPEIQMNYCPQKTVVWRSTTWNSFAVALADYRRETTGEVARPKFTVGNPEGIFSPFVHAGFMDGALVTRYRVLDQHLRDNVNSYIRNSWRVGKVLRLDQTSVTFELREAFDWQQFVIPGRAFYPPEFPAVSL